jgi:hypothetical protein
LTTYAKANSEFESYVWHSRGRLLLNITEMVTDLNEHAYKFKLIHLVKTTMDITLMSDIELLYFKIIGQDFFKNFDFASMTVSDVQFTFASLAITIKECV